MLPTVLFAVLLLSVMPMSDTASAQRSKRQMYPVRVGQLHPEFKLPNVENGQAVSLSDYRGKKTLLVHFASW